ncbi:hypothetical protein M9H77_18556 [Catharanthus roseus]|uniref:Uncharacterized protein n=1 Tax=Catharanthus roseus TaxID=4058 RepID=A0ACC0B7T5_CATRO|nr:hypothetical protein M9H77_18556 [Catharanthus roseus]
MREAHAAREREILESINERDWLRRFLAQFLSTARDSIDRARVELESWPEGSDVNGVFVGTWHSSLRIMDMRQSKPIRETTPRPKQATHKVIENFMIKMTEFFDPWSSMELHGEVEQEIKAELFLGQLNDIYDTLKYEDAMRVMFAAFRLRRDGERLMA